MSEANALEAQQAFYLPTLDDGHKLLDLEGLAAPQGRAFDIAAKVGYDLAPNLTLTAGLRMLDGGGDNDEVYNFARFYYGVASVIYRF